MYREIYLTLHLFVLSVFQLDATLVRESLQGYNDGARGKP